METELEYLDEHGKVNSKVWKAAAVMPPTIGILGAVLGFDSCYGKLERPQQAGCRDCRGLCRDRIWCWFRQPPLLPFATKLEGRHRHQMIIKEMILEGVIAVSTGENPRLIEEKLHSFLSELQKNKNPKALTKPEAPAHNSAAAFEKRCGKI